MTTNNTNQVQYSGSHFVAKALQGDCDHFAARHMAGNYQADCPHCNRSCIECAPYVSLLIR